MISKKNISGKVGMFWRYAKKHLDEKMYNDLKSGMSKEGVLIFLEGNKATRENLMCLHEGLLKKNGEKPKKQRVVKEKDLPIIPDLDDFLAFGLAYVAEKKLVGDYTVGLEAKYDMWRENGWRDGYNKPIKNWKVKLRNVVSYIRPIYGKNEQGGAKKISGRTNYEDIWGYGEFAENRIPGADGEAT